jgi:hypothetical protein
MLPIAMCISLEVGAGIMPRFSLTSSKLYDAYLESINAYPYVGERLLITAGPRIHRSRQIFRRPGVAGR